LRQTSTATHCPYRKWMY